MSTRRWLVRAGKIGLDLGVLGAAFCLAFLVRFEGSVPSDFVKVMLFSLPVVVLIQLLCVAAAGLYRSTWRYISLPEAERLFLALAVASALIGGWRLTCGIVAGAIPALPRDPIPWGVVLLDLPLGFLGIIGLRVGSRLRSEYTERRRGPPERAGPIPTLLIGAGRAGALVAKELAAGPDAGIRPVGFLDDDPNLLRMEIHGLPVLGTTYQVRKSPSATAPARRSLPSPRGPARRSAG